MNFQNKKLWNFIVTLFFIIAVFAFYFLVYVKSNENQITINRFRVLSQIGKNIESKYNTYHSNAENMIQKASFYFDELSAKKHKINTSFKEKKKFYKEQYKKYANDLSINKNLVLEFEQNIADSVYNSDKQFIYFTSKNSEEVAQVTIDKFNYSIFFKAEIKKFLNPLLREGFFDEFAIINRDKTIYFSQPAVLLQSHIDSIKNSPTGLEIIEFSNAKYKIFIHKLKLKNNEDWYLCGLMDLEKFVAKSRRLQPIYIVLFSILFLMLLLAMPLLKLLFMSAIERLNMSTVIYTGISIILTSSMLFILVINRYELLDQQNNETDQKLGELASNLQENLTNELNAAYRQLNDYDSILNTDLEGIIDSIDNKRIVRNVLSKNKIHYDANYGDRFKDSVNLKPDHYPYFKNVFWIGSDGKQKVQFSTKKEFSLVSVKHRNYFNLKDKWPLPNFQNSDSKNQRFYLESIISLTSGAVLAAISKKSEVNKTFSSANNQVSIDAIAMSTKLHSIIDPVLPMGFGFSIIDATGSVKFHSDKKLNLQENFIEECENDKTIKSVIQSHHAIHTSINYHENAHRAYILPLKGMPLYLVTFYDNSYKKAFNAQILTFVIILIISLFLAQGIQTLIMVLMHSKRSKLKRTVFAFNWLRPYKLKNTEYHLLFVFNLCICIIMIVIISLLNTVIAPKDAICFIFIISTITYSHSYWIIRRLKLKIDNEALITHIITKSRNLSRRKIAIALYIIYKGILKLVVHKDLVVFLFIAVIPFSLILLISLFVFNVSIVMVIVLLLIILLVLLTLNRLKYKISDFIQKVLLIFQAKTYIHSYVLFIFSWLLIVAIIPVFLFHKIAIQQESIIWLKQDQIGLTTSLSERENKIERFYKNAEDSEKIKLELNKKGIYSGMINTTVSKINKDQSERFQKLKDEHSNFDNAYRSFLYFLRPVFDKIEIGNKGLVFQEASDSSFFWVEPDIANDTLSLLYNRISDTSAYKQHLISTAGVHNSDEKYFTVLKIIYWPIMAALIILLFRLILLITKNIFPVDLFDKSSSKNVLFFVNNNSLPSTYQPLSNKYEIDFHDLRTKSSEEIIEGLNLDTHSYKPNIIAIINFEINSSDSFDYSIKALQLFDQLWLSENNQIVICSASGIVKLKNSINTFFSKYAKQINKPRKELIRYKNIFNNTSLINAEKKEYKYTYVVSLTPLTEFLSLSPHIEKPHILDLNSLDHDEELKKIATDIRKNKSKVILITNLHLHVKRSKSSKNKLDLLQAIIDIPTKSFIIYTTMNPMQFFSSYKKLIEEGEDANTVAELKYEFNVWREILKSFVVKNFSIRTKENPHFKTDFDLRYSDESLRKVIISELEKSDFLKDLEPLIHDYYDSNLGKIGREDIILKIQNLATSEYEYFWDSCSKEEKFILYDLSKDLFVNTKNADIISVLIEKGLLVYKWDKEKLEIMNKSFRNYILSNFTEKEIKQREDEVVQKGIWDKLQTPIVMIIFGILVFIIFIQEHLLDDINAIIASFGGLIGLFLRFGGFYLGGKSKRGFDLD